MRLEVGYDWLGWAKTAGAACADVHAQSAEMMFPVVVVVFFLNVVKANFTRESKSYHIQPHVGS